MAAAVIVHNLVKRYGTIEAVRGVGFEAGAGEIFGLLGPNGAGKTTTVECLIGLRRPDAGRVEITGIDALARPSEVKQRIGAQLQATALQDKITPREALTLFGSFYDRRPDVQTLIDRFALAEKADAPFDTLSGGQRQRLALAVAFVNEPAVLFLDEPTAGLDPQSRRELHESIRQMRAEGRTILLTTHYIAEAHDLCDRIAIINQGRIVASGSPAELIAASKALAMIVVRTSLPLDGGRVLALAAVRDATAEGNAWRIKTTDVSRTMIELVKLLEASQNELLDLSIQRPSLEDVFIELTGGPSS